MLLGMALCHVLCTCPSLLCPVVARDPVDFLRGRTSLLEVDLEECRLDPLFNQRQFVLLGGLLSLRTCPFVFTHGVVISLVCSLVGPFGGFLASGFKRGCRRKVRSSPPLHLTLLWNNLSSPIAFRTLAASSLAMEESPIDVTACFFALPSFTSITIPSLPRATR